MVHFFVLLLIGLALVPSLVQGQTLSGQEAMCGNASVFACENFESRTLNSCLSQPPAISKGLIWNASAPTNCMVRVDNTNVHDGTKSLAMGYPPLVNLNGGGGFIDTSYAPHQTMYIRWWVKYSSNFVFANNGTNKQLTVQNGVTNAVHLGHSYSETDRYPAVHIQDFGSDRLTQNVGTAYKIVNNEWICFEYRITINSSPTSSDGIAEGWINDVLTLSYTGKRFFAAGPMVMNFTEVTAAGFNGSGGGSTPAQTRWVDGIVMSTSRIGCGTQQASPTAGSPTPSTPSGLTLR